MTKTEDDWLVKNLMQKALQRINNIHQIESAFFKDKNSDSDLSLPIKAKENDSEIPIALSLGEFKPLNGNQDTSSQLASIPDIMPCTTKIRMITQQS